MTYTSLKLALAGVLMSAVPALAVTFDFNGLPTDFTLPSNTTYTQDGVTLGVRAASQHSDTQVAQKSSPSYHRGLGVVDSADLVGSIDSQQSLDFMIPEGYRVSVVTLTARGGAPQAYQLLVDNVVEATGNLTTENTKDVDGRTKVSADGFSVGSIFSVQTSSSGSGGVFVNGLRLTAVPLPSGAVLLLTGLAGAGAMGLRRKG